MGLPHPLNLHCLAVVSFIAPLHGIQTWTAMSLHKPVGLHRWIDCLQSFLALSQSTLTQAHADTDFQGALNLVVQAQFNSAQTHLSQA